MTIAEPSTMLTDYALAGVSAWLGWRLLQAAETHWARRLWAIALMTLAFAAVLGGTSHGFSPVLSDGVLQVLWMSTVLTIGVSASGMFSGSAIATAEAPLRRVLLAFAIAQLALYSIWMFGHDEYFFVVADTAAAMAVVAALHGWSAIRHGDRASWWMLGGVGISALAAAVQASGFALHRHFNHNDLYHVIQIVAMALFFKGAVLLRDRASLSRP